MYLSVRLRNTYIAKYQIVGSKPPVYVSWICRYFWYLLSKGKLQFRHHQAGLFAIRHRSLFNWQKVLSFLPERFIKVCGLGMTLQNSDVYSSRDTNRWSIYPCNMCSCGDVHLGNLFRYALKHTTVNDHTGGYLC